VGRGALASSSSFNARDGSVPEFSNMKTSIYKQESKPLMQKNNRRTKTLGKDLE
jgi:hypothetical protein